MKEFYKSIYTDLMTRKRRVLLFALAISAIYLALIFGTTYPHLTIQILSQITAALLVIGASAIIITDSQHGMRNQKSIFYVTLTILTLFVVTAIEALIALIQGRGLYDYTIVRDDKGVAMFGEFNIEAVILVSMFILLWTVSIVINNKLERKQKIIKGIHSKNIFK